MGGPLKKRVLEEVQDSDSSSSDENPDVYTGDEMIEADFEGRNPEPFDFHGIKQLLQQLFLRAHIDLTQLSDFLIGQKNLGSVLKQVLADIESDEDDDMDELNNVYGITTVINLTDQKDVGCVQQLRDLLVELAEQHGSDQVKNTIRNLLGNDAHHVGLLINERFVNIPAKIADPLFGSLITEINRAVARNFMSNFSHYILICKLFKQDAFPDGQIVTEAFFSNSEEELFDDETDIKFEFSVKNECDSGLSGHWLEEDESMTPYRRVLIFPSEKLPIIYDKVKNYCSGK